MKAQTLQAGKFVPPQQHMTLQRKCDCGNHTVVGGECGACAAKKNVLQRPATNGQSRGKVPDIVHEVLRSPGQRHLVQATVETEFARLFAEGGLSPSLAAGSALPHVSANGIQLAGGNDPVQLGRQIAQSVYGGTGK